MKIYVRYCITPRMMKTVVALEAENANSYPEKGSIHRGMNFVSF